MKFLLSLLLVCTAFVLASGQCEPPRGWPDHDEDDWSSWSLQQTDPPEQEIDWEQLQADLLDQAAEEMGLSVDEARQFFSEMEQGFETISGERRNVEAELNQVLEDRADLLSRRGDAESLVQAALLLWHEFDNHAQRIEALVEQAVRLEPFNTAALWLAVVSCNRPEASCSARDAAQALTSQQPDNIAAWRALYVLDESSRDAAVSGVLGGTRYIDASDALAASLVSAYTELELSTVLKADLERVLNRMMGAVVPVSAEHLLLLRALAWLQIAAPTSNPVEAVCQHARPMEADGQTTDMALSFEVCRQHYVTVVESARNSFARDLANGSLILLAENDPDELAHWQDKLRQRHWLEFLIMTAQMDGLIAVDRAYLDDVLELGDLEAGRLQVTRAGIAIGSAPEEWERHKAMMQWMGERIRQSQ